VVGVVEVPILLCFALRHSIVALSELPLLKYTLNVNGCPPWTEIGEVEKFSVVIRRPTFAR
jgi:hypothetical protein